METGRRVAVCAACVVAGRTLRDGDVYARDLVALCQRISGRQLFAPNQIENLTNAEANPGAKSVLKKKERNTICSPACNQRSRRLRGTQSRCEVHQT